MKRSKPVKIKYLYQQLISHMGVLLVAFLIMSIVFAHYVERLVYQNTVDELISYGENILNDITRGSRSVSNIVNEYSLVLKGRNISFSIFDQEGSLLYPSGNLRLVDEVLDQIAEGKPHVVRNRIKHSNQEVTLVALPYIMNDTLIGVILLTAPISGSREMISQINQYLFFTALLAFALAILPSWLLSKVHVNRIKRLQEATSMVSKGDYSVNLPHQILMKLENLRRILIIW